MATLQVERESHAPRAPRINGLRNKGVEVENKTIETLLAERTLEEAKRRKTGFARGPWLSFAMSR